MRTEFLPHTKKYLLESLNKQMTEDANIEFIKQVNLSEVAGGAGVGVPYFDARKAKRDASDNAGDMDGSVLFGQSNINMPGALGVYAAGKGLKQLADFTEYGLGSLGAKGLSKALGKFANVPILGSAAQAIGSMPGQIASSMLRNLADLSGADWFDANVQNIGRSEMALAAQGAGKPWVPLQIPKPSESEGNPYDPSMQRKTAIARAKEEEEAKKYRGMGYSVP